jgi:glucosamine--fructose-6-phosphate aminotransferase (isomerizing)
MRAGEARRLLGDLLLLPDNVKKALMLSDLLLKVAKKFHRVRDFLYLGRGINYPIALEGALKLKEISYIHAEGYPAGEMKHGPIALIDDGLPVLTLIPDDETYGKMLSNLEEVRSRGGQVIAVTTAGKGKFPTGSSYTVCVPKTNRYLTPVLLSIPLHLLAYHIAVLRKCNVDQPRNLAKSVTVE